MFRRLWPHAALAPLVAISLAVPSQGGPGAQTPRGNLGRRRAHWVSADTILWDVEDLPGGRYELYVSAEGALRLLPEGVGGGQSLKLTRLPETPPELRRRFPHLGAYAAFALDPSDSARARALVRGALAVAARDSHERLVDASGVQIPGVLDDLFAYTGPLGVTWAGARPTVALWAPTASAVRLLRFADSTSPAPLATTSMAFDGVSGVWRSVGEPEWRGQYYLFEVEVWAPSVGGFVTNRVTDPYALSLSANSTRSQIVDLDDPELCPEGWAQARKPPLEAPEEIVLYELHIRDFSAFDQTTPPALRGTYGAFSVADSAGMRHLRELADAGVTHIHLLPAFDFATVEERRERREPLPLDRLTALPAASPEQQAIVGRLEGRDGYNWGYDPLHYTTPEGGYSTEPDGPARIREFRAMVAALNQAGLRVVLDVVYNHTHASGQDPTAVLDRIVPGYYHRLDLDGNVTNSTCCSNTATEHAMMEKLMVDSLTTWARAYRIDGFRFDLMGHHLKRNMLTVRAALDALTPERDGVDGRRIWLYGEGWDFGEVARNARGENATQANMAGTGIGSFSDRLRDAARGGGFNHDPRDQGFLTGLATDPSAHTGFELAAQRRELLHQTDLIKLGLAGNLAAYRFVGAQGTVVTGALVDYNGAPAGYTMAPREQIVYVSAHDNETLFDAVQLKAPATADIGERARMAMLGLSLVLLAQGVPFLHAGDELLRSKSLDRNSFRSSDWFNRVDWTGRQHVFGSGLPPAWDNEGYWPIMGPLLADPALRPTPELMARTKEHVLELLRIRKSTPLFRLREAAQIQRMVRFFNEGPEQVAGLILMSISDNGPTRLDALSGQVLVAFNAAPWEVSVTIPELAGARLALHPVQTASRDERVQRAAFDAATGTITAPARTSVVFIGPEPVVAPFE